MDITTSQNRQSISTIDFLGEVRFPTGFSFGNTEVGGISGLTYDAEQDIYYAISDDSTNARFYTITIDLSDGSLNDGDVLFTAVTTLLDETENPFAGGSIDSEGIVLRNDNTLYISSEGDANQLINPFVNQFSLEGQQIDSLPIPDIYLPTADESSGIRNNLAFESLTITPNQQFLFTATENALFQDGSEASLDSESLSRIIKYDLTSGEAVGQFVYQVGSIAEAPIPENGFSTNGLVELLAIDNNGTFLALERAFVEGGGNTVKLFEVQTQGALDVSSQTDLFRENEITVDGEILPPGPFEIDPAVSKRELLDIEADLGITPDNLEALALGPVLPDGRQSLIVVSDNNFSQNQSTQVLALALDFNTTPAVLPVVETPFTVDDENGAAELLGDSDDPAIWVNPDPERRDRSLIISTLKDGGLVTFNLDGEVIQTILPAPFGDIRYNNVDLVYGFNLGNESVDLVIASDRENDTLAIFKLDPETLQLEDVTSDNILETIFNVDDGNATAYGLATYTSPADGTAYAFVTQADGNQVAQLELSDDEGSVNAEVVRILDLPVPTGDPEDSQSEGIVVDQELGFMYVALEDEVGILKFSADPEGGNNFEVIQPIDTDFLVPDIEGLNIYYGPNKTGYLIANSQGDSSYAVFTREGNNEYLGSFIIGDNGDIDQVNESDGLDVVNVSLGSNFPGGLLVVQDGANDPQNAVEDEEELENNSSNFKFVSWEDVATSFEEPLIVNTTSYDPRNPGPQSFIGGGKTSAPAYVFNVDDIEPTTGRDPEYQLMPLITVGEEAPLLTGEFNSFETSNTKTYAMAGIPDGLGISELNDGTYLVWMNHELDADEITDISSTIEGQIQGARVSVWKFDANWNVIGGQNLITKVIEADGTEYTLDLTSGKYLDAVGNIFNDGVYDDEEEGITGTAGFARFCSGYLAHDGFVDTQGNEVPIWFAPEEENAASRGWAVTPDGTAQVIAGLGGYKKENVYSASQYRATNSNQTVLIGTEDDSDGEIYMYVGQQTEDDPNGLIANPDGSDFDLYVLRVKDEAGNIFDFETIPENVEVTAEWVLVPDAIALGDGNELSNWVNGTADNGDLRSTNFRRWEDIHEDPNNPGTFYGVTTGRNDIPPDATEPDNPFGKLYRFSLNPNDPTGEINNFELLMTGGAEKGVSYDNVTVDSNGNVLIQEDETGGGGDIMEAEGRQGRILSYNIAANEELVGEDNPAFLFELAQNTIDPTQVEEIGDWESSGIIEVPESNDNDDSSYLFTVQAHSIRDFEEADGTVVGRNDDGDGDTTFYEGRYAQGGQLIMAVPDVNPILDTQINRFQNQDFPGTYLFADETESISIRENFPNFIEEGEAFKVAVEPGDDLVQFNRFQNEDVPGTYLLADETESISIRENFPNFIEEGIAFYVYGANANKGVDFYRFQNQDAPGTYIFVNETERQDILTNFPNFIEEGVAFEVEI